MNINFRDFTVYQNKFMNVPEIKINRHYETKY